MTRREQDERAIEESEAAGPPPLPARKLGPGPLPDRCALCRELVMVHDRAWEKLSSTEGLVAAANYCDERCRDEASLWPEDIAREMRARPDWRG